MAIGGKDLKWDPSLKEDHFDAVLLYDQEDVDVAITIKDFIENKIPSLEGGRRPRICIFDSEDLVTVADNFDKLEEALPRSTYFFLLITEHFVKSEWCRIAKNACLQSMIKNKNNRRCTVPIYLVSQKDFEKANIDPPILIGSIKGIHLNTFISNCTDFKSIDLEFLDDQRLNKRQIDQLKTLFNKRNHLKQEREEAQRKYDEREQTKPKYSERLENRAHNPNQDGRLVSHNPRDIKPEQPTDAVISDHPVANGEGNGHQISLGEPKFDPTEPLVASASSPQMSSTSHSLKPQDTVAHDGPIDYAGSDESVQQATYLGPDKEDSEDSGLPESISSSQCISDSGDSSTEHWNKDTIDHGDVSSVYGNVGGPKIISAEDLSSIYQSRIKIGTGGYSTVFQGNWNGKKVAVKKMERLHEDAKFQFSKERAVAFLRHPHILPVLAITDEQPVPDEFVFPLKHCNLADAIKAVRPSDPPPLKVWTWQDFCRILFQTAKGLRYLHTPIPNVREAIRHGDLKPGNILLDIDGNAFICDTGLAVEMPRNRIEVTATDKTRGTFEFIDPDVRKTGKNRTEHDIYAFGKVFLQILMCATGEDFEIDQREFLFRHGTSKKTISDYITESEWNIWNKCPVELKDRLISISIDCMEKIDKRISISDICTELEDIFSKFELERHNKKNSQSECCMCQFYEPVENLSCCDCENARFCSGCLQSSNINPLVCTRCGPCEPPIGGSDVHLLFIAGLGVGLSKEREAQEHVFSSDVLKMRNCFSDSRVIGVRPENIHCLFPSLKYCTEEDICTSTNIVAKLDEIRQKLEASASKRRVVILYMSCHSGKKASDQLSWHLEDELSCDALKERLVKLPAEMILTIFDCCYASQGQILPFHDSNDVKQSLIQWSSCHSSEKSKYDDKKGVTYGSYFTLCVLKGLTLTSRSTCPEDGKSVDDCCICQDYRERIAKQKYINFSELHSYVRKHLKKKCDPKNEVTPMTPRVKFLGSDLDIKMAYHNEEPLGFKILYKTSDGRREQIVLDKTLAELKDFDRVKYFICMKIKALPTEQGIESFAKAVHTWLNRLCITFVNAKGEVQKIESMEQLERLNDRFEMFECYVED